MLTVMLREASREYLCSSFAMTEVGTADSLLMPGALLEQD